MVVELSTAIDMLREQNAALSAELETVKGERDAIETQLVEIVDHASEFEARSLAAEAKLAGGEVTEAMVDAAEAAYAETMRGEVIGRTHLNALRAALEAALRGDAS